MLTIGEAPSASGEESLGFVRARSLADQVADALVEGIATGVLKPGQRLVELDIARRLAVSRVPVREAIKTLSAQGIVELAPHRGARVVPLDGRRFDQIREARLALEEIAIRDAIAAIARDPGRRAGMLAAIAEMAETARSGDKRAFSRADLAFHRALVAASGNEVVGSLWDALARHVWVVFGREIHLMGDQNAEVRRHEALLATIDAGDPGLAAVALREHIMRLRPALGGDGAG